MPISLVVLFLYIQKDNTLKKILIVLSILIIGFQIGCSIIPVKDPEELAKYYFRKSLKFEIDGKSYEGVAVLPRKETYNITIIPDEKMTFYIFQTPHRDIPIDKPDTGWFNKKFSYKYTPQTNLEDRGYTPLKITALNKDQVSDAFAFIEFKDANSEISLEANVKCNGELYSNVIGVSICQTAKGLIEEILFKEKVLIESVDNNCVNPTTNDGILWRIKASEGECPYYFTARTRHENGHRLSHRLTMIGYTKVGVN